MTVLKKTILKITSAALALCVAGTAIYLNTKNSPKIVDNRLSDYFEITESASIGFDGSEFIKLAFLNSAEEYLALAESYEIIDVDADYENNSEAGAENSDYDAEPDNYDVPTGEGYNDTDSGLAQGNYDVPFDEVSNNDYADDGIPEQKQTGENAEDTTYPAGQDTGLFEINEFDMLMRYNGTDETVVIPDGVKEIANRAFDGNDYVGNIFQTLCFDNDLYGFPYEFQLKTVVSNNQLFDGDNSPHEFMNKVRNSGADILECGKMGSDIVLDYFLSDMTNTDYIDWENGVSHLNEASFLEIIEFAKEFEDSEYLNDGSMPYEAEYIKSGKALFKQLEIDDIYTDINFVKALFGSDYFYMGYPTVNGNGTFIEPGSIYLSSFSKEKEGALEFIRYCVSLQHQDMIADWKSPEKGYWGIRPKLPVIHESFERMIEEKRHNENEVYYSNPNGLKYKTVNLDDKDISKFREIVDNASGWNYIPDEVKEMVYEELSGYFEGVCSAKEAADALDSRITVYLNEKK